MLQDHLLVLVILENQVDRADLGNLIAGGMLLQLSIAGKKSTLFHKCDCVPGAPGSPGSPSCPLGPGRPLSDIVSPGSPLGPTQEMKH